MATSTEPETVQPKSAQKYVDFDEYIAYQLSKTRSSIKLTDVLTSAAGVATLWVSYLLLFTLLDHWVVPGGFSNSARSGMFVVVLLISLVWIGWKGVVPYLKKVSSLFAARAIERSAPEMKSALLSLVDLEQSGRETSPAIRSALEKRAAVNLSHIDTDQAVDRRHLMWFSYALMAVVILCCLYTLFSPKDISFARALFPATSERVATQTDILNVKPGDVELPAGSQLEIFADLRGEVPERVTLFYSVYSAGDNRIFEDVQVQMREVKDAGKRFRAVLIGEGGQGIQQNMTYRIVAGDATTRDYAVTVLQPPSASVTEVAYTYPSYMRRQPRTGLSGHINDWEGTTVSIRAKANMPLSSAWVRFADDERTSFDAETEKMTILDGTTLEASWTLKITDGVYPRYYWIDVKNAKGESDPDPARYNIKIRPDEAPEIVLHDPAGNIEQPANAVVPIWFTARDPDFMLTEVRIRIMKDGKRLLNELIDFDAPKKTLNRTFELDLSQFKQLRTDDVVRFWIEARDNKEQYRNLGESARIDIRITEKVSPDEVDKNLKADKQQQREKRQELEQDEQNQGGTDPSEQPKSDGEEDKEDGEEKREDKGQNQGEEGGSGSSDEKKDGRSDSKTAEGNDSDSADDKASQTGDQKSDKGNKSDDDGNSDADSKNSEDSNTPGKPGGKRDGEQKLDLNNSDDDEEIFRKFNEHDRQQRAQNGSDDANDRQHNKGSDQDPNQGQNQNPNNNDPNRNDDKKPGTSKNDKGRSDPNEKQPGQKPGDRNSDNRKRDKRDSQNQNPKNRDPKDQDPTRNPNSEDPKQSGSDDDRKPSPDGEPEQKPDGQAGDKPNEDDNKKNKKDEPGKTKKDGDGGKSGDPQDGDGGNKKKSDQGKSAGDRKSNDKREPSKDGNNSGSSSDDKTQDSDGSSKKSDRPLEDGEEQPAEDSPDARQKKASGDEKGIGTPDHDPKADPTPTTGEVKRKKGTKPATRKRTSDKKPADSKKQKGNRGANNKKEPGGDSSQDPKDAKTPKANQDAKSKQSDEDLKKNPQGKSPPSKRADGGKSGSSKKGAAGKSGSSKPGAGDSSDKPGDAQGNKQKKPGKPGGKGSGSKSKDGGQGQPAGKKGSSKNGSKEGGKKSSAGGEPGAQGEESSAGTESPDGKPGEASVGSGQGGARSSDGGGGGSAGPGSGPDGQASGSADAGSGDDPDAEAARKSAGLVLKRLKDQLDRGTVDKNWLKKNGWDEQGVRKALERIRHKQLQGSVDKSRQAKARRKQWNEFLKSLTVKSRGMRRRIGTNRRATGTQNLFAPGSVRVPLEYREEFEAYKHSLSKRKTSQGKKIPRGK